MKVYIKGCGVVSAAGAGVKENWKALQAGEACFAYRDGLFRGEVPATVEKYLTALRSSKKNFHNADRSLILGALAVQEAMHSCHGDRHNLAVIAGSSRGATSVLEREHARFLRHNRTSPTASPYSSPGTFPALISKLITSNGISLSLSATCATGIYAAGMGLLCLQSGLTTQALCVCSESPLTPFTLNMLQATRVLADKEQKESRFPLRPLHPQRTGTVIAEGAAALLLTTTKPTRRGVYIAGYGCAVDNANMSLTGVSRNGEGLVLAIERALTTAQTKPTDIQLIIGHGSSTLQGDRAEWSCYKKIFAKRIPPLRFHKWCVGHSLASSALFSTVMAHEQIQNGEFFSLPYLSEDADPALQALPSSDLRRVLITSLGFGGNCAALVLACDDPN